MRTSLSCLMAVALTTATAVTARAGLSVVATGNVLSYDMSVYGNTTHVVYESGGNIYHSQSMFGSATWSPATSLGAGSKASIAFSAAGVPIVSLVSGGNVVIASPNAGTWSTTSLGNPNGTTRAMIRTDGNNTVHLLVEGSGTGGRGSIDYASFNGSSWSSFANLAYGWYDSGSGNYYHQPVLGALSDGAGYYFVFEQDNWGEEPVGRARLSPLPEPSRGPPTITDGTRGSPSLTAASSPPPHRCPESAIRLTETPTLRP